MNTVNATRWIIAATLCCAIGMRASEARAQNFNLGADCVGLSFAPECNGGDTAALRHMVEAMAVAYGSGIVVSAIALNAVAVTGRRFHAVGRARLGIAAGTLLGIVSTLMLFDSVDAAGNTDWVIAIGSGGLALSLAALTLGIVSSSMVRRTGTDDSAPLPTHAMSVTPALSLEPHGGQFLLRGTF